MNRTVFIILLIFLVPLALYWSLSKSNNLTTLPSVASTGAQVIKFSSPMCFECQELDKVFKEVYSNYDNKITLKKVNVSSNDNETKQLIKKYNITLVPTTIFQNSEGSVVRRIEGSMQPKILDNYLKGLANE